MEDNENLIYNIVKSVKSDKKNPIIRIGNDFIKEFLFDENKNAIDFQITGLRIILLIHNTFTNSNDSNLTIIQKENHPKQLKIFEEEFLTEHNNYIRVSLKNSHISKEQNRSHIEKAIEFLVKLKMDWYVSYNAKGQKIKSFGGLITMPTYEDKGYTTFLISSYWLQKILLIDSYTAVLLQTAFKISSAKEILFLLWLSNVNREKGTKISLELLNQRFNLNYKTTKSICDQFLRPLRNKLDKYSLLSFNFSRKENIIQIMPYSNGNPDLPLDDKTKEKVKTLYKLSYFKKRHALEGISFEKFKIVYNQNNTNNKLEITKAYELLKEKCKIRKWAITLYQGEVFLKELQECIKENYSRSEMGKRIPNGHIIII